MRRLFLLKIKRAHRALPAAAVILILCKMRFAADSGSQKVNSFVLIFLRLFSQASEYVVP